MTKPLFIELTLLTDGRPVLINVEQISDIYKDEDRRARLSFGKRENVGVKESYEDICETIAQYHPVAVPTQPQKSQWSVI